MSSAKVRHQLFLPKPLSDRLEALAAKPGASKSAILADAVAAWLNRRGTSELDDRFGIRLDRMTAALGRVERDGTVILETLALFVRYELAIHAPLAENDQAGRAMAATGVSNALGLREAASGGRAAAWGALNRTGTAPAAAPGGADGGAPTWARELRAEQAARHHRHAALQTLKEGDRGGASATPDIKERED